MEIRGFVFDTSSWIAAGNEIYPPTLFPDVWELIKQDIVREMIKSPTQVRNELEVYLSGSKKKTNKKNKNEEDVYERIKPHKNIFVLPPVNRNEFESKVAQICVRYPRMVAGFEGTTTC